MLIIFEALGNVCSCEVILLLAAIVPVFNFVLILTKEQFLTSVIDPQAMEIELILFNCIALCQ